jgi:D-sedoheptulose 7-phosphate isomerase
MREFSKKYFDTLIDKLKSVQVANREGQSIDIYEGIERVAQTVMETSNSGKKLIFVGNGASAAISSHMSTDYWKNGGIRAIAFNDSSLLTCISNDYGYKHVFEKPVEMFADAGDMLFAISSSGKSENILLATKAARLKKCQVTTFSGFASDNPLSSTGDYNFYVDSPDYGPVEIIHLAICHCICDVIIQEQSKT